MTSTRKQIAIYVRVSSKESAKEGYSLEAQKQKLSAYAEIKEWDVYKIYEDAGISGKSIKGRKAFQEMMKDAYAKNFSGILIFKLDRAFRNTLDALKTLDTLKEIEVDLISISEQIDTTTAMGKMFFTIISSFAQMERELTAERMSLTLNKKFEDGIMVGKSPAGYKWSKTKKEMVVDEPMADIVKDIFKMTIEGKNYKEICEKYKGKIKQKKKGKIIYGNLKPQSYYNIIRNPVYIGVIEFNGVKKIGRHTKIIDYSTFKKVNPKFEFLFKT